MIRKVFKTGNSLVLSLPRATLAALGLSEGSELVYFTTNGTRAIASCVGAEAVYAGALTNAAALAAHIATAHPEFAEAKLGFTGSPAFRAEISMGMETDMNQSIGGITIIAPDGSSSRHVATPDPMTTNICFGGKELRTAFITCSMTGRLLSCEWDTPGLPLNFLNR